MQQSRINIGARADSRWTQGMGLTYFPKQMAQYAVVAYFVALIIVSVRFSTYAMQWYWWVIGIIGVCGFFFGVSNLTKQWGMIRERAFEKKVFWTAFVLRAIMVFFLYWFFNEMTGKPFMFSAADSFEYGEGAKWMARTIREGNFQVYWDDLLAGGGVSDAGYPLYLGFIYLLTNDSIIAARLVKSILSAFMCVLVYRLAKRNFGESAGRLAAIICMLEPHFLVYCGQHLKETEMLFLVIFFLERADNLLRSRDFRFWAIAPVLLILLLLFTFRTVLGVAACFAFLLALVLSNQKVANLGRRWIILIVFVAGAGLFVGGRVASEIELYWNQRDTNQESRMTEIRRSQGLAKYATKAVFAPMIFTIPFPTLVETPGQDNSRLQHAGFIAKNVLSFFCIFAVFLLIFNTNPATNWRNNVLLGAYMIAYLVIILQSAFVHADRFHLPAYVVELIFAAYGVTVCVTKTKYKRWFMYWCVLMTITWVAWNWFKLAGRGLA